MLLGRKSGSGRDDTSLGERETVPATEVSSRPARSAVVGPAVRTAHARAKRVVPGAPTAAIPPLHLQANQQATPRSAFTELITTRNLSLWFLITAAFIAFGLGALARPGTWPRQDHRSRLSGRLSRYGAACLAAWSHRHRFAYCRSFCPWRDYPLRLALHRARAIYPWLGVFSGLTIAGLGGYMFCAAGAV